MIISVDFGHSTVKASNGEKEIMFPSVLSEDIKEIDPTDMLKEFNDLDYMRVCYKTREYFIGKLAKNQSQLCLFNCSDDDVLTEQTKLLIYTAINYLLDDSDNKVQLVTTLPISHYGAKYEFESMLLNSKRPIIMDLYNYQEFSYQSNYFNINEIAVRPQGLFALMNELLNENGEIKSDKKELAAGYNVVVDIGFFSTDVYITKALEHINFATDKPLPGISEVYKMLSSKVNQKFGVRKRLYELEDNVVNQEIRIQGKSYGLEGILNQYYSSLAGNLISNIYNLVPNIKEVDRFILTGGGATPLHSFFKKEFSNVLVLEDSRLANCRGGLKWAKRRW